ncbi:ankyrin repeat domain-containing protein [Aquimarina sp. AD10]|uniref:ankyrin repeat domain-containing protein n=1 Tax=Aquimarina TaxID=290174 RepID=UPI000E5300A0|nr:MULTISPECIES: ankyrin repeat domain-containing protein [Aquimarina]AXT63048.1 ankyrin repeat domain-containing protein [Aquimarina sp. AD10]RKM96849.1 ankyrin repeat domain-containing protein [Aquimarina sp. AD10]
MKELNAHIDESNLEIASRMIMNGADINEEYGIGIRPIIAAINSGNTSILKFVIENGADLNIDNGKPLREAIDIAIDSMIQDGLTKPPKNAMDVVKTLLDSGANFKLKNKESERPIDIISAYAHNNESFEQLKSFFRPLIPQIDELIKRN